jgi:phosphatidate cytidylyltransferase
LKQSPTIRAGKEDGEEPRNIMSRQFKQRVLMSSLGIIGLIFCVYFSFVPFFKPIFILLNATVISLALKEYYDLCKLKELQPLVYLGIASVFIYLATLSYSFHEPHLSGLPSLILLFLFLLFFLCFFKQQTSSLSNLAVTLFGFVYLVIPLSCILRINYFFPPDGTADGRLWIAYVLIVTKMTDIGGYFFGKCFGKTKLAPKISPKKTVEGAIGGVFASLSVSLLFSLIFSSSLLTVDIKITLWQSIWLGLCISIMAQLGDLGESLLKRDAGVKDSSHLPGLGGFLDVVDSLVFTLPFVYLMLQMHLVG